MRCLVFNLVQCHWNILSSRCILTKWLVPEYSPARRSFLVHVHVALFVGYCSWLFVKVCSKIQDLDVYIKHYNFQIHLHHWRLYYTKLSVYIQRKNRNTKAKLARIQWKFNFSFWKLRNPFPRNFFGSLGTHYTFCFLPTQNRLLVFLMGTTCLFLTAFFILFAPNASICFEAEQYFLSEDSRISYFCFLPSRSRVPFHPLSPFSILGLPHLSCWSHHLFYLKIIKRISCVVIVISSSF